MSDLVPHLNGNVMPADAGLENAPWFVLALLFWGIHLVALPAPYSAHYLIENDCALFSSTCYIMVAKFFFPHLFLRIIYIYKSPFKAYLTCFLQEKNYHIKFLKMAHMYI